MCVCVCAMKPRPEVGSEKTSKTFFFSFFLFASFKANMKRIELRTDAQWASGGRAGNKSVNVVEIIVYQKSYITVP